MTLEWQGPVGGSYRVEVSADLLLWHPIPSDVISPTPGRYSARRCPAGGDGSFFYRVRLEP